MRTAGTTTAARVRQRTDRLTQASPTGPTTRTATVTSGTLMSRLTGQYHHRPPTQKDPSR